MPRPAGESSRDEDLTAAIGPRKGRQNHRRAASNTLPARNYSPKSDHKTSKRAKPKDESLHTIAYKFEALGKTLETKEGNRKIPREFGE